MRYVDTDDMSSQQLEHWIVEEIMRVPPQKGGILPSEMYAFIVECFRARVSRIVESGRKLGYSTEVLSRFHELWKVDSVEQNPCAETDLRFADCEGVTLHTHDSQFVVPVLLDKSGVKQALLIDGPKELRAFSLMQRCQNRVKVCGVHDCFPGSQIRIALEAQKEHQGNVFFTDAEWFLAQYGWMDDDMFKHCQIESHSSLYKTGGVMGIIAT